MSLNFLNVVIDISHHEGHVDFDQVKQEGILSIISKVTHGVTGIDKTHKSRRDQAKERGLLWGSYHFGTGVQDGAAQAQHFWENVDWKPGDLIALDFEPNVDGDGNQLGPDMTLAQARDFVRFIASKTGRYPLLYGGHFLKEQLGDHIDPVLVQCPLWLAQYTKNEQLPRWPEGWASWTLWQYTDGKVGPQPHTVLGIGKCDRNFYIGKTEMLRATWGNNLQSQEVANMVPHTFVQPTATVVASHAMETKVRAEFHLKLAKSDTLIRGRFILLDAQGAELLNVSATSGLATHQKPADIWFKDHGPLPPNPDVEKGNTIRTRRESSEIIPGAVYHITPEAVTRPVPHGVTRDAFRVHFDGGTPGSAGCIAVREEGDFETVIKWMHDLHGEGIREVPLTLHYT